MCLNHFIIHQTNFLWPGSMLLILVKICRSYFVSSYVNQIVWSIVTDHSLVSHSHQVSVHCQFFGAVNCPVSPYLLYIYHSLCHTLIFLILTFCHNSVFLLLCTFSVNVLVLSSRMFFHLQLTYWFRARWVFLTLAGGLVCDCARTIIIINIIIIKRGCQCKAEREWYTPYLSEDPRHTIQTYRQKKEKWENCRRI